jgi:hypothetical protein
MKLLAIVCKHVILKNEQSWGFKGLQPGDFRDSKPQCPHESLKPEADVES